MAVARRRPTRGRRRGASARPRRCRRSRGDGAAHRNPLMKPRPSVAVNAASCYDRRGQTDSSVSIAHHWGDHGTGSNCACRPPATRCPAAGADGGGSGALRERRAAAASVSRRNGAGAVRHGLLLGCGAQVLADAGRREHGRRATRAASRRTRPTARCAAGRPGHAEVVLVVFDPSRVSLRRPAAGCSGRATIRRRACGRATTSARSTARPSTRSTSAQARAAAGDRATRTSARLTAAGYGTITTEIAPAPPFYYAEDYHQQYLAKNPGGYCGLGGTGVTCPVGSDWPPAD